MLLSREETGLALKYWSLRSNYQRENCRDKNRICRFCNIICPLPNFEDWLEDYRRNKVNEI